MFAEVDWLENLVVLIFFKEFNFTNIRLSFHSGQPSDESATAKSFPRSREQHPIKMVQR